MIHILQILFKTEQNLKVKFKGKIINDSYIEYSISQNFN
jgi:hypothetical protein